MLSLLDVQRIAQTLEELASRLAAEITPETETVLVGIRSRGVPLANRLCCDSPAEAWPFSSCRLPRHYALSG